MMTTFFASSVLLPHGWASDVRIEVDATGEIVAVERNAHARNADKLAGAVVPGLTDLHSHAFQRAMAGLAERAGPQGDNFWSWREIMYRFLAALSSDDIEAIAAQLYAELLCGGYTGVVEFHYLHNDPAGKAYADPLELASRIVAAREASGIGLALLPVLYQCSQFGGVPPTPGQRRFVLSDEAFASMTQTLCARYSRDPHVRIGIAPHSLRAVTPDALARAIGVVNALDRHAPIHIHAAEQTKEVDDCFAWSGQRPVEWLLDHANIDARWCLVHCTHMTDVETRRLAQSGTVAGLCPTTEANLGDGLFALPAYLAGNGVFGIGSDANVCANAAEELRWLEYAQRLHARARNLTETSIGASTGANLFKRALTGGARASGRRVGAIAAGHRADFVVLDTEHPSLVGRTGDALIDAWLFATSGSAVRDVIVSGEWRVRDYRHVDAHAIAARYNATLKRLLAHV